MTTEKLQEILQSDEQITLDQVKEIIYELKNDCCRFENDEYRNGYYNGEMNAFYICLDLLDKVDPHFVGIEDRVSKLEEWRKLVAIQNRVLSLLTSMRYGTMGDSPQPNTEYWKLKLNQIFAGELDGYNTQMTILDEEETNNE